MVSHVGVLFVGVCFELGLFKRNGDSKRNAAALEPIKVEPGCHILTYDIREPEPIGAVRQLSFDSDMVWFDESSSSHGGAPGVKARMISQSMKLRSAIRSKAKTKNQKPSDSLIPALRGHTRFS